MQPSLWSFIADASLLVKFVMLILFGASIASWIIIFQRGQLYKQIKKSALEFEDRFWSGTNLNTLFTQVEQNPESAQGQSKIFLAGFKEFGRLQSENMHPDAIMEACQRAMRVAKAQETEGMEKHLSFLATVGSTSPYIGLFGTVWGIMTSFRALGAVQQASIAMVAPGISEALIATAMGLFAAIPAVIAYNKLSNQLEGLLNRFDTFQEEFSSILHREIYRPKTAIKEEEIAKKEMV